MDKKTAIEYLHKKANEDSTNGFNKGISGMPYQFYDRLSEIMVEFAQTSRSTQNNNSLGISEVSAPLPSSFKDIIRFIEGDRIDIKLYGNDGHDNQEVIDGRKHMIKWITDAWNDYSSNAR